MKFALAQYRFHPSPAHSQIEAIILHVWLLHACVAVLDKVQKSSGKRENKASQQCGGAGFLAHRPCAELCDHNSPPIFTSSLSGDGTRLRAHKNT